MMTVRDLCSGYGRVPVLRGLSFAISPGECVSILGHNGMGKTTLLRTLMGFLPATGGSVAFEGSDVTRWSTAARARRGIGYVVQGREIFSSLSVRENLRMGCLGAKGAERDRIDDVLTLFPRLKGYLHRPGGALSGGEQQLLALARCLCARPRLLCLDEPTEGIQPSIVAEMAATLAAVRETRGLTILLVEQNVAFIRALAQRVLVLRKGEIVGEVPPGAMDRTELIHEFTGLA